MNPLFNQYGGRPGGPIQAFEQFRRSLQGDPRQQIQALLNSGRVTQEQYNNAVRLAQQFAQILGR